MSTRPRIARIWAAALFVLVVVSYLPSLDGDFIWDDHDNVADNPMLRDTAGLARTWASPFANVQFYPLTHTSFWLEYRLWGAWPTGYRITNVVLHLLVATMLAAVLVRLDVSGAVAAASVFALHPVHVETVAWITERKNLLSAMFCLLAVAAWVRYASLDDGPAPGSSLRRHAYVLTFVFFVAALLSKTAVAPLPAALLVLVWWKRGRLRRSELLASLPLFGVAAVFGVVTSWLETGHLGAGGTGWTLSSAERLLVAGRALWFYAATLPWPFDLNFIYPRWSVDSGAALQYAYPLAAVGLFVVLWGLSGRIGRGPLAAAAIFAVMLAPALGFFDFYFQLYSFVQDHHQYLASAAPIALGASLVARWLAGVEARARIAAFIVVLVLLGSLTWRRAAVFHSEEALWGDVIERNPQAWMAHLNLGFVYERQGRMGLALEQYRASVAADPDAVRGHLNLADKLVDLGLTDEAERHHRSAVAAGPDSVDARADLGRFLAAAGRHDEAVEHYRAALALGPDRADLFHNVALSLEALGMLGEAEAAYRAAIRIDPNLPEPHNNLAIVLLRTGRADEARIAIERYRRLGGTPHPGLVRALTEATSR